MFQTRSGCLLSDCIPGLCRSLWSNRLWALMSSRRSRRCPNRRRDSRMRSWQRRGGQTGVGPRRTMLHQTVPIQGSWEIETAWGNERQQRCLPVEPQPWREGTKGEHPCQLWQHDISHSACYLLHQSCASLEM